MLIENASCLLPHIDFDHRLIFSIFICMEADNDRGLVLQIVINDFDTDLTLFISIILLGLALPEFRS